MKLSVNLKLNQSLKLTPLLQQSIKLLQASQNEINDLIEEYLKENIFLHIEDDNNNLNLNKNYKASQKTFNEEENFFDIFSNQTKNINLKDHLIDSIALFNYSERDQVILYYLIDAINDDGYLLESNLDLIKDIPLRPEVSEMDIKSLIKNIQSCSLPGIGARSISECLILQLENINDNKNLVANAKKIAKEYLNEVATNKIKKITKKIGDSEENIFLAINLIKKLNPKPGLAFKKILHTEYINHDLTVLKDKDNWKVYLNDEEFFKIKLNEEHEDLIKDNEFLKEQFQEAKWLVKNLEQRSITILRVARAIMKKQKSFLDHGPHYIKPMILKNIAKELELHESTISRVTTNKFIKTPHGLYELKFFFGREYSENNNAISSKSILAKIKDVILHEDKNKPYSDERIVQLLKEGGITIARRTVTKYREILNILPSNHRKGKK